MRNYDRRSTFACLAILGVVGVWRAGAQTPAPAPAPNTTTNEPATFTPTELQRLRIENKQQAARLAQVEVERAQQRFQQALFELTGESEKIKAENLRTACKDEDAKAGKCVAWAVDDTKKVLFNPNNMTFAPAAPGAEPPASAAPKAKEPASPAATPPISVPTPTARKRKKP